LQLYNFFLETYNFSCTNFEYKNHTKCTTFDVLSFHFIKHIIRSKAIEKDENDE